MPTPDPSAFEKLGTFYLGREYDLNTKARLDNLLLYDSKDLVTHAVCVGMTGSGKTGLCLALLEEAAIDGIPAIVIDPKGDLANLLLTFPELRASDFRPWINEEDARRRGLDPDSFATSQAEQWKKGLAEWGQDGARIARFRDAAERTVYTPGSNAGVPVSVLKSFDAPARAGLDDPELFRERVAVTATGLLAMLGIDADPVQSREHIFLSALFADAWGKGQSLDLASLIARTQNPGFTKLGVMELETVYPAKDRFGLAMALNNLVAAPGFSSWVEGNPLDIQSMLYSAQGRPRMAIFSIAHLTDPQRMFFVTILLNQVLTWVRAQSGTGSLRALVYMDEIAGYFPPVANPPSKQPLLTLMKQARAFGVGVVLSTQNPVDLDYKGLANAGTWFIGRLQTDRDKQRVLDGLEGASAQAGASFDRATMDRLLSALGPRLFLMNNVHEDTPVVFETRWCLSYLRGPLTREQIRMLNSVPGSIAGAPPGVGTPTSSPEAGAVIAPRTGAGFAESGARPTEPSTGSRPILPPEIPQYFLAARAIAPDESLVYRPALLGLAKVYYQDPKAGVNADVPVAHLALFADGPVSVDWDKSEGVEVAESDLVREPSDQSTASFAPLPADAQRAKSYDAWKKDYADVVFRSHSLELLAAPSMKIASKPGENERDFRGRLAQRLREERDAAVEKLRAKYAPKLAQLADRTRRAEQQVEVQREQARSAKIGTAMSLGSAILGAFMGRKALSATNVSRAATAFKGVSRAGKESSDVGRAEENVGALNQARAQLEQELQAEIDEITRQSDPAAIEVTTTSLRPKRTGITVRAVCLVWEPCAVGPRGERKAWA